MENWGALFVLVLGRSERPKTKYRSWDCLLRAFPACARRSSIVKLYCIIYSEDHVRIRKTIRGRAGLLFLWGENGTYCSRTWDFLFVPWSKSGCLVIAYYHRKEFDVIAGSVEVHPRQCSTYICSISSWRQNACFIHWIKNGFATSRCWAVPIELVQAGPRFVRMYFLQRRCLVR